MTTSFTDAMKRKVVAEDTADDIGKVKTFVCDVSGTKITQIQVAGRKRNAELVDYSAVASFGADVVLIRSEGDLHEADDERANEMVRGNIEYIGSRVLSSDGQEHGKVTEVHFDEANGDVVAFLGDVVGRVEASKIRSLGSYAVVADIDAAAHP